MPENADCLVLRQAQDEVEMLQVLILTLSLSKREDERFGFSTAC